MRPSPRRTRAEGTRRWRPWRWAAVTLLGVQVAAAAAPPPATAPPQIPDDLQSQVQAVSADMIQQRLTPLEAIPQPTEGQTAVIGELKQALALLQEADAEQAKLAEFEAFATAAPDRVKELQRELATPVVTPQLDVPRDAKPEELTPQREAARTQLESAQRLKTELESEALLRKERRARIPDQIAADTNRREELLQKLGAAPDPQEAQELTEARRIRRLVELRMLEARLVRLPREIRSYDARRELLELRRQQADRRVTEAQKLVAAWDQLITERQVDVAEQTRREAAAAAIRAAIEGHPVVHEITLDNKELATELTTISSNLAGLTERKEQIQAQLDRWSKRDRDVRERVEQIGLNEAIGIMLRKDRNTMPDLHDLERGLRELERTMLDSQLREIDLLGLRDDLEQTDAAALLEASDTPVPPERWEEVLAATETALAAKKRYVADLLKLNDTYFNDGLDAVYQLERQLAEVLDGYASFIDERILWIRSTDPLQRGDAAVTLEALAWLASPAHGADIVAALWRDFRVQPVPVLLGAVMVMALLIGQRRIRIKLRDLSQRVGRATTDRFGLTVGAAILTVLIAAPWPALVWLVGWRLTEAPRATDFVAAVAAGLLRVSQLWLAANLLRQLCRADGLGGAHFRWPAKNLALVRHGLGWLVPVVLPLAFLIAATGRLPEYHDTLGRVAFIVAMLAVMLFVFQVFHPERGIAHTLISHHRGGWLDRLKFFWFNGLVLAPLALAVATGLGFFYTSLQLEQRCVATAMLVVAVIAAQAMLLRWLLVAQRRLALEQARQRQAQARAEAVAAARAAAESGDDAPPAEPPVRVEEVKVDVRALTAQTRSLLRSLVAFAIVVGLFMVWVDVLPALGILREIELWTQIESFTRTVTGDLGEDLLETVQEKVPITLADLLLAIVVFAVTMVVSKNIPGLLEITILQRLPFSPSSRYAITTIVRYALFILGIILSFAVIGIGWSRVQWLAAAVVFGLGFGLQEIFANFVSGLIILFERPVRVGDTVTVNNIHGTVSRIRIRATTITDWDRKELIIPNKEFVTGNIVNWSLSDALIRIRVPVGIAYGSDTKLAKRLMLEVARETPHVLGDPEPSALFLGFGESSLDFELRVFIPSIDHFLSARDALNMKIDEAFRQAKVEIAFPQRDLHVRSVSEHVLSRVATPEPADAAGRPLRS